MGKSLIIVLLVTALISCKQADKFGEARKIYEESMEIHDLVMPKMGELMSLRQELKTKKDSINDQEMKMQIDSLVLSLDLQHKNMMDWMKSIQPIPGDEHTGMDQPSSGSPSFSPGEMEKIQSESLEKIKNLEMDLNEGLKKAREFLDSHH
ncbi:MAG TPA: hypothetical protein VI583_15630 [Cyclobacteriaceae bacterium]|nr:hypothetical protein [Cyclobacteriaceae bacterium]